MRRHIAVVGCGFAGLAAALELIDLGFSVTALEARQRVGGRVWSTELPNGAIVELGGEWITSSDQELFKMAQRLDQLLVEVGIDFRIRDVVNGPAVSPENQRKAVQIAGETLASMDETIVARSTVGDFLDDLPVGEPQRMLLRSRLQGSFGADLSNVALRMLGDFSVGQSGEYYRIGAGNQSLAGAMAARLPDLRLGHVTRRVVHHQGGVSIKGEATECAFELEAAALVVAIPLGPLNELEFDPALPQATEEAIASVPSGLASKLVIGTREPPPLRAVQDMKVPYWSWTGKGESGVPRSAVTAFCGSEQAQRNLATTCADPSIWLGKLRAAMPEVELAGDPIMVDWSQDEWSRGCYSAFDNRAADLLSLLSQPVGNVFFAGEHTDKNSGTMEGAIASGLRAARQVSEVLQ